MENQTANILIVDDIESNREVLEKLVSRLRHRPLLADHGLKALEMIHAQAESAPVDLVLLDIMMPGMSGYEVLSQIKDNARWRHIPVIMVSAVEEVESVINCLKIGADDYLTKPFNTTLLTARINNCLEKKYLRDKEHQHQQEIEAYNYKLKKMVEEKTRELTEANERLHILAKHKSDVLQLLYKEFNRPFHRVLRSFYQLFSSGRQDIGNLLEIIRRSKLFSRIDLSSQILSFEIQAIQRVLQHAVKKAGNFAEERHVYIGALPTFGDIDPEEGLLYSSVYSRLDDTSNDLMNGNMEIEGVLVRSPRENRGNLEHQSLCAEALTELLKTSARFAAPESTLQLSCEVDRGKIYVRIMAEGRQIADHDLPYFFEVPTQGFHFLPGREPGQPFAASHILNSLGGSVRVDNVEDKGIAFTVILQLATLTERHNNIAINAHT